jgi:hypothetical protein
MTGEPKASHLLKPVKPVTMRVLLNILFVPYRSTRTAWPVTQWTEIPPTSGAHLSVGSGSV